MAVLRTGLARQQYELLSAISVVVFVHDDLQADMAQVVESGGLRTLSLASTKITDVGVRELKRLKALEFVDLNNTRVTDACLQDLKECKGLREIWLDGTAITQNARQELRRSIPGIQVRF